MLGTVQPWLCEARDEDIAASFARGDKILTIDA
jgi:hypothetical protein